MGTVTRFYCQLLQNRLRLPQRTKPGQDKPGKPGETGTASVSGIHRGNNRRDVFLFDEVRRRYLDALRDPCGFQTQEPRDDHEDLPA